MHHLPHSRLRSFASLFMTLLAVLVSVGPNGPATVQPAQAATDAARFYVKPDAESGRNCLNWAGACTLAEALQDASYGDEIWVAKGVYKPTSNASDRDATFELKSGVAIYGGFAGSETAFTQRKIADNLTVLSGDIDDNDQGTLGGVVTATAYITGDNAYRIVTCNSNNVTATAVLDGFTITAGDSRDSAQVGGSGMFITDSSPTLANITFSGNAADKYGGGMFSNGGSPILTNVTFSGNSASENGGGMYNGSGDPILTNVTFSGNSASEDGGGMYNGSGDPTLTNVTFSGNSAFESGGGMYNSISDSILTNVTFVKNTALVGGGMSNRDGSPTLTNVTFSSNSASDVGGGMYNFEDSGATLTDVIFSGNSADLYGGGIYNSNSDSTLTRVTFDSNVAASGGGMYNASSSPILANVTFNGNAADNYGGGMSNNNNSNPTLTNAVFSDNTAATGGAVSNEYNSGPTLTNVTFNNNIASTDDGRAIYTNSTITLTLINVILWDSQGNLSSPISGDVDISYSLIAGGCPSDSICDTHLLTTDPLFVDAANGNLRLQANSPAIDAGDKNTPGLSSVTTDRDGNPRFVDAPAIPNTGNGTPPVDMGAYEYNLLSTTTHLEAAPNPARLGQTITFVASVAATAGTPGGSVAFYDGESLLGSSGLLASGSATFTTKALPVGAHTLTARYAGEGGFLPSISNAVGLAVNPADIYLPLALNDYVAHFNGEWEREPNNNYLQANGPLVFGQVYYARPNDAKDYFSYFLPEAGSVTITMNNHTGQGVQMLLYDRIPAAGGEVKLAQRPPYTLTHNGAAGWYYIYIYTANDYNATSSYTLLVNTAAGQ